MQYIANASFRQLIGRIVRYAIVGGTSAIFAYVTSVLLFQFWHFNDLESQAAGFIVGTTVNYPLSRLWAFKNRSRKISLQASVFITVTAIGLGINEGVLSLASSLAHVWIPLGMLMGLATAFIWNFILNNQLTFGRRFPTNDFGTIGEVQRRRVVGDDVSKV